MTKLFLIRQWLSLGPKKDLTLFYALFLPLLFFFLLIYLTAIVQGAEARASLPLYAVTYETLLAPLCVLLDLTFPAEVSPETIQPLISQMVERIKELQAEIQLQAGGGSASAPSLPSPGDGGGKGG
jgi:hypothetical protein